MPCYPLVFFDAIRVKISDEGFVRNKAIYIALGILPDGTKEILGIWIEQTEGAKFWLRVMNELKNRGVSDILIAVVDGLKGFPEAINAVFPADRRADLHRASDPPFAGVRVLEGPQAGRAAGAQDIYRATDAEAGLKALEAFEAGPWGAEYPAIAQSWRRNWEHRGPVLRLPGRRAADHLHHQRDRGAELQAAPRRPNQRTLPPMTTRRSSCYIWS